MNLHWGAGPTTPLYKKKNSCSQFFMLAYLCELNGSRGGACKTASGEYCGALGEETGGMWPQCYLRCGVWGAGWHAAPVLARVCVWSGRSVDPGRYV